MISKVIAAQLYAYGYKLRSVNGFKAATIKSIRPSMIDGDQIVFGTSYKAVEVSEIGKTYFILARPLSDLTKEVTHDGETFVPIVELAKIVFPDYFNWKIKNDVCQCFTDGIVAPRKHEFYFEKSSFRYWSEEHRGSFREILNQYRLFDKLCEWNFAINLPEGSWLSISNA